MSTTDLHQEIDGLLSDKGEDRFLSPLEARKKAMDFLARREYGFVELCRKLADKGFDRDITTAAIETLRSEGLQSDHRFAESFTQSRINQGKGPVRIRLDLSQKGVSETTVEAALEAADVDWKALAADVKIKKFGSGRPEDFKAKAKMMQFLKYRGFESGHIQGVVD